MRRLLLPALALSSALLFGQNQPPQKPDPEAAWAEVQKASRPPQIPANWTKEPTAEQRAERNKFLADKADEVANLAKKFYETFPDHPKADEAKTKEKAFRAQAASFKRAAEPESPKAVAEKNSDAPPNGRVLPNNPKLDPKYEARLNEALAAVRERHSKEGPAGALAEYDKWGRILATEFPEMPDGWKMLQIVVRASPGSKSLATMKFLAEKGPPELREQVEPEFKRAEMVGKPLKLAFTATDGTQVDVSKMKGKVVLIDFWATWCGPCIASLPEVLKLYSQYHDQGLEIIGISFDDDCDEMKRFIRKREMTWAQFCDGGRWQNAINKQFDIRGIPTMFLVGKDGVLRDIYARENLPEKIEALLKEKE